MNRIGRVFVPLFLFVTFSGIAAAQGAPGFRFGITGGADFPLQDQSDVYKTGWNGGLLFAINFGDSPFGLRFQGTYDEMHVKDLALFPNVSNKTQIIAGVGDIVIGARHGAVQPYLIGGVGVYDMRFKGQVLSSDIFSDSTTRFGWNAGGGLAFPLGGTTRLFVEARYTSISVDSDRFSNSIHTGGTRFTFLPVNLGFVF
jgi:opacity protein-like surface antigen